MLGAQTKVPVFWRVLVFSALSVSFLAMKWSNVASSWLAYDLLTNSLRPTNGFSETSRATGAAALAG
jgi:hypothetical protein